jgi:replicative DNA helicase
MSDNENSFCEDDKGSTQSQMRDTLSQVLNHYVQYLTQKPIDRGLSTGLKNLDAILGGLMPGLHLIGGRPMMGKTTLMLHMTEHISMDLKVPSLIFSGELRSFELVRRILFSRAMMNPFYDRNLKKYIPIKIQLERLKRISNEMKISGLYIEDDFEFFIENLVSISRRYKEEKQIGLIAIDCLQMLRSKTIGPKTSQKLKFVEMVAELKSLALELNVPILLLTNLTQGLESRDVLARGRPVPSDIRYDETLNGYADTVSLLYRPQYYADNPEERKALLNRLDLFVHKNLFGDTGEVRLHFDTTVMRITDEEEYDDYEEEYERLRFSEESEYPSTPE